MPGEVHKTAEAFSYGAEIQGGKDPADQREKPPGNPKKTQADHLPTFMKTAKNREQIVKLLLKLQDK